MVLSANGIAALVAGESLVEIAAVLERLSQREQEVRLVVGITAVVVLRQDLGTHPLDVRVTEAKRLEVREAPVGLADRRAELDRVPVGGDGLVDAANGLQRVAVVHVCVRLLRVVFEDGLEDRQRRFVLAFLHEERAFHQPIRRVARLGAEQRVEFRQCVVVALPPYQRRRVILACEMEMRRELEAAFQEVERVIDLADADTDRGQEPDGAGVQRILPEHVAHEAFRFRELAVSEEFQRLGKLRVAHRRFEVAIVGVPAAVLVTLRRQLVAERLPCRRVALVLREQLLEHLDRSINASGGTEAQGVFVGYVRIVCLPRSRRFDDGECFVGAATQAETACENSTRSIGIGIVFEDLPGGTAGRRGVLEEQPGGGAGCLRQRRRRSAMLCGHCSTDLFTNRRCPVAQLQRYGCESDFRGCMNDLPSMP